MNDANNQNDINGTFVTNDTNSTTKLITLDKWRKNYADAIDSDPNRLDVVIVTENLNPFSKECINMSETTKKESEKERPSLKGADKIKDKGVKSKQKLTEKEKLST